MRFRGATEEFPRRFNVLKNGMSFWTLERGTMTLKDIIGIS